MQPVARAALPGRVLGASARCSPTRASTTRRRAGCACRHLDLEPRSTSSRRSSARPPSDFRARGLRRGAARLVRSIDMRYVGQNWELTLAHAGRRADARRTSTDVDGAASRPSTSASTATRSARRGARDPDLQRRGRRHAPRARAPAGRGGAGAGADRPPPRRLQRSTTGRSRRAVYRREELPRRRRRSQGRPSSGRSTRRRCCRPAARRASTSTATSSITI